MELLYLAMAVAAGAGVTWLTMRSRYTAAARDLAGRQEEVRQERQRVGRLFPAARRLKEMGAASTEVPFRPPWIGPCALRDSLR